MALPVLVPEAVLLVPEAVAEQIPAEPARVRVWALEQGERLEPALGERSTQEQVRLPVSVQAPERDRPAARHRQVWRHFAA